MATTTVQLSLRKPEPHPGTDGAVRTDRDDGGRSGLNADRNPEETLFAELAQLATDEERSAFLSAHPDLQTAEVVAQLCDRVNRAIREDLAAAERLLATAGWLAEVSGDRTARGRVLRASANLLVCKRDYLRAVKKYEAALDQFRRARDPRETVRTLSSGLSPLSFTGDYERALEWAARARTLCEELGDPLLRARLEFNTGHVLSQQNRPSEAFERYRSAYEFFLAHGETTDIAVALRNMAVCQQELDDFDAALETYRKAGDFCAEHGLARLGLLVEYNVAYLHFLRGDHERTLRLLDEVRIKCEELEDGHHKALCDLDQAEIYLELNLNEEAAKLAGRAAAGFAALDMRYEQAKAVTYEAIAGSRTGRRDHARDLFQQARDSFVALDNRFWTALLDVFRSQLLYQEDKFAEASVLAEAALEAFLGIGLPAKIATCEVLLARLAIHEGDHQAARTRCESALSRIIKVGMPTLEYQAHFVAGLAMESAGKGEAALAAYRRSESVLEGMRSLLRTDELKIAFSHGQQSVYEGLVAVLVDGDGEAATRRQAFDYIQKAKSRGLSDLLASRIHELRPTREVPAGMLEEINSLRAEANWCHHQISLEERKGLERSAKRLEGLRNDREERERLLLGSLRRLQMADPELGSLQAPVAADLESLQSALPEGTQLLEYFTARGVVCACLLDARNLRIRKLARVSEIQTTYKYLRAQLGRMRFAPATKHRELNRQATEARLGDLYDRLIRPLLDDIGCRHLIVAPHGLLHHLPFCAFHDGKHPLIDAFSISYAPSATVFQLCSEREVDAGEGALVMGVADERAPLILDEVQAVAGILPESRLLVGEEASAENLARHGETCRFLHIATHGMFRRENPMFSAVGLGTSRLSVFDLYNLRLRAELVVLSGCSTGLSAVLGADELVGLTRGLLYAGARAVLVTLWDVNDQSTSRFMTTFYKHLAAECQPAKALRRAQQELREEFSHPYHWAPFILVGRVA